MFNEKIIVGLILDNLIFLSSIFVPGVHPLLLGRGLSIGGRYAKELPPEMSSKFLEAAVNGLQDSQPICICISSIKAIYWFCEAAVTNENTTLLGILRPQLPNIFQGLLALSNQPSKEILTLVMDTFSVLAPVTTLFFMFQIFINKYISIFFFEV